MTTLQTTRFGELRIDPSEELVFPRGLLGFPGRTRFLLLPAGGGAAPGGSGSAGSEDSGGSKASGASGGSGGEPAFCWLQSTEDPALAFVVTDPHLHVPGFRVPVGRAQLAAIGLEGGAAAASAFQVLVIVNKRGGTLTGNLQGPLLVNTATRVGEQFVLSDKRFGTAAPLVELKPAPAPAPVVVLQSVGVPAAMAS